MQLPSNQPNLLKTKAKKTKARKSISVEFFNLLYVLFYADLDHDIWRIIQNKALHGNLLKWPMLPT